MIENYTKGIKAFNSDATCRGFKFEEGKTYEVEGDLVLCENGFHFSPFIACTLAYYPDLQDNIYAEVEALGEIIYEEPTKLKAVTNKIKIVRFLSEKEVIGVFDRNSNTGNWNTGDNNTGDSNTGHRNTGHCNTGDSNTGDCNTGNWNTGHCNTGNRNTGDCNTGDNNTGDSNTGHRNTGHRNTGNCNTGNRNTGNSNTGNWNTGHCNTGNRNTGDWNTGNWNTGYFNTNTPRTIRIFNLEIESYLWEDCDKPRFIYFNIDPELGYKESFIKSYESAPLEDKVKIFNIPNFNKELFFEISGIDVTELEKHLK